VFMCGILFGWVGTCVVIEKVGGTLCWGSFCFRRVVFVFGG
jgi:hypothetical protein